MEFNINKEIKDKINELDEFIERVIKPLENKNRQFFDHRREYARTDWENDGKPTKEWEALLRQMKDLADKAGHLRFALPEAIGGQEGSNLAMAMIREHLAQGRSDLPHVGVGQMDDGGDQRGRLVLVLGEILGVDVSASRFDGAASSGVQAGNFDHRDGLGSNLRADEVVDDQEDLEEVVEILLRNLLGSDQEHLGITQVALGFCVVGERDARHGLTGLHKVLQRHAVVFASTPCGECQQEIVIVQFLDGRCGRVLLQHGRSAKCFCGGS